VPTLAGLLLVCLLLASPGAAPLAATEVEIFQIQSRSAFLAGTPEGVSVDPLGRLELADRIERLTAVAEPFVFSAAAHPDGWVVGTGNAGRVLKIDRRGKIQTLFEAGEPEVFALWADPDGTVFAGTSPEGKVYRIPPGGGGEVFFDPGETYIWGLTRDARGDLLVATGTQGKLYRVSSEGEGEVVYDSDDTHLRSLAVLPGGDVLVGTAGEGLILRLSRPGSGGSGAYEVRTLYDADQPEVVALTAAADGTAYAALAASEASLVDLSRRSASSSSSSSSDKEGEGDDGATVTVEAGEVQVEASVSAEAATVGSRRGGFKGPRSVVLRIGAGGFAESLAELEDETVFALLWHRGRLWLGTGMEGKLYTWTGPDGDPVLEKDLDERQVVALVEDDPGPAFVTTNAAALYRVTGGTERQGTYTSAALDAEQIARFGTFHWRGRVPKDAELTFSFRSGMSAEPDRTWAPWTEPRRGEEIPLGDLPLGRYVQWRAHFQAADGTSPVLFGAELSYLQENLSPKIERFDALDPGQVLVPANFNPMNQVWEPAHPSRDGIFTTLDPSDSGSEGRLKPLWKKGYRTLRWRISDPNGDQVVVRLDFRPDPGGGGEAFGEDGDKDGDAGWLRLADDLEDDHLSFDATALPDGVYRFRLRASDAPRNGDGHARTAEQVSEPVVIDHGVPVLEAVAAAQGEPRRLTVRVADALSPLREAVVSFDAGGWKPVEAADGLLDGRRETLTVEVPEQVEGTPPRLLLLRLTDASFNVVTFDLSAHLPSAGAPSGKKR
jgi:hypothetical protein